MFSPPQKKTTGVTNHFGPYPSYQSDSDKQTAQSKWTEPRKKKLYITFHNTGWLIGISTMGYNKPYNKG